MSTKKFKNKYRIESTRSKNYDYSLNGAYFITIVTKNREHFFGEIINGKMQLSNIGIIVKNEWFKSPKIRPDMNLNMDEFVVMPNHIHGIIVIGKNQYNSGLHVETRCIASLQHSKSITNNNYKNKFGPQRKNLSSIIRGFKSAVTKNSREINLEFGWQSLFHDCIIRNYDEFNRIKNYIILNPEMWERDRNKLGIWS